MSPFVWVAGTCAGCGATVHAQVLGSIVVVAYDTPSFDRPHLCPAPAREARS